MTYLGEGSVCLRDWGQGKTTQINYKMNFIAACNVSKNAAMQQVSSSPFQQVTLYHSNSCMLLYTK